MNSNNKAVSASEFPIALFSLGLPILLAAYGMNGSAAPQNLAEILVAGLAVLGLLVEPYRNKQAPIFPLWLKAGIPCVLLFWAFSKLFTPLLFPLAPSLPFLMEIRPLLYGLVIVLWITNFSIPKPEHFYFWASWLAVLVICNFLYLFLVTGLTAPPNLFGNAELTGPILLAGLCSTLHEPSKLKITRLLIFTGIMCTLSRDAGFAAVLVLLFFGPKGAIKKTILVLALVLFNFLALASHEMTFFNPNDLPAYWLWFSILDLFEKTPSRLLIGHPLAAPLPLNIPASIWELWHKQNFAWTGSGTYIFHVTPIWLHILTAWGIAGIAGASAIATTLSIKYSSDTMASLVTAVIITGFFSPLFYSPATGIVLIMAFICATQPAVRSFKFE